MIFVNKATAPAGASNGLLTDLESYWKLDEASGTIYDSHGSNDSTSINGNPTYGATGIVGDCLDFDGTGDSVVFGNVLSKDYNDSFTIQCWYKPNSAGSDNHFLVCKQDNGGLFRGYVIWRGGSGQNHRLIFDLVHTGSSVLEIKSTTRLTNRFTWYHIVLTYDGTAAVSGLNLYINGSLETISQSIDSLTTGTTVSSANFEIGARSATQETDGLIDEVGVWNRVLDSTDVSTLYNLGSGLAYGDFTS